MDRPRIGRLRHSFARTWHRTSGRSARCSAGSAVRIGYIRCGRSSTRDSSSKYRLNGRLKRTRVGAPRPEWRQGFVLPNSSGKLAMLAVTAAPRRASYGRRRDLLFVCWASQRWLNGGGNLSSGDVGNVRRVAMSRKSEIRRSKIPVLPIAFGISLSALLPASVAFACGGFLDAKCNLEHGGLSPGNIAKQTQKAGQDAANTVAKAGQDVANAINELQASVLSGPTLERAIIASHDTAINGAMPIPPLIRQQLTGYASEDSMNRGPVQDRRQRLCQPCAPFRTGRCRIGRYFDRRRCLSWSK